jgi:hypothetical protein
MARAFWGGVAVVSVVIGGISGLCVANAPEYEASTRGELDEQYTEVRSRKGGTRYEVTYSFAVDGRRYTGRDSIRDEPRSPGRAVYYDPSDPKDNGLSKEKDQPFAYAGLFVAFLGLLSAGKRLVGAA